MIQVILQPSGAKKSEFNYNSTMRNPTDLSLIKDYVPEEIIEKLEIIYPHGKVPTWGVTPGKSDVNARKWARIKPGDVALFSGKKQIFASATVTLKHHNRELALRLWGEKTPGETWEYVYFLDEVIEHSGFHTSVFNEVVGYEENSNIQGFNVLDYEKSERVLEAFELKSEAYYPEVTRKDFAELIKKLSSRNDLNKDSKGKTRAEQHLIRGYLFHNNKTKTCGVCGNLYPVELLVAAHIKKRSKCNLDEMLDVDNIVMPMCKFGCDELYERGYIVIDNGVVVRNSAKFFTPELLLKLREVEGRTVSHWNEATKKYFNWHKEAQTARRN